MKTPSLHIVRRYGPVGGMERYVWELTHALASMGHPVKILCEKAYQRPHDDIEVHELGECSPKPRWLSMLRFSRKVSRWMDKFPERHNWAIHSHERTAVHDVTTFHGPPFAHRKRRPLDLLSPRINTWEFLEKRELCGDQVQKVQPNSELISEMLNRFYPCCANKLTAPAYPGVSEHLYRLKRQPGQKRLGFIGKEWQRKGLPFACNLIKELLIDNPDLKFKVAGPETSEIQHLFKDIPNKNYELMGWTDTESFLKNIDLLVHPAEVEPYGMVVAEANAAGIPVIISDKCGVAPLINQNMGGVLQLSEIPSWKEAVNSWFVRDAEPEKLNITWQALAQSQSQIYTEVIHTKQGQQ